MPDEKKDEKKEKRPGEVYADGHLKIPKKSWTHLADSLTRQDELMEVQLKVLGSMNRKLETLAGKPAKEGEEEGPPISFKTAPITERQDLWLDRVRGKPAARIGRYEGADADYQTIVEWSVGKVWDKRWGMLEEVSVVSDNFPATRFRLTIDVPDVAIIKPFEDVEIQAILDVPFPANRLPYDTDVRLECYSTGPAIQTDGKISGKEWS